MSEASSSDLTLSPEKKLLNYQKTINALRGRLSDDILSQWEETFRQSSFRTPDYSYTQPNFDLKREIDQRKGLFVEVAGPTDLSYDAVDFEKLDKKVHISNIDPGIKTYHDETGEFLGYVGNVDFQANSQALPFQSNSIGVCFESCADSDTYGETVNEAYRVLEPGGLFVYQLMASDFVVRMTAQGFVSRQISVVKDDGRLISSGVFQKPE